MVVEMGRQGGKGTVDRDSISDQRIADKREELGNGLWVLGGVTERMMIPLLMG